MDRPATETASTIATTAEPPQAFHAAIFDMNGILRGKRLPGGKLGDTLRDGTRMPMSSVGVDIWGSDVIGTQLTLDQGDLDGVCHPTGRGLCDLGWTTTGDQPL